MKNVQLITLVIILINISALTGCSSYMHGYTQHAAFGKYMLVDAETEIFCYERITYIIAFRGAGIASFIEEKGYPDYLHEYKKTAEKKLYSII